MKRQLFTLAILVTIPIMMMAEVTFTLQAPQRVTQGQNFHIKLTLTAENEPKPTPDAPPEAPKIKGCTLVQGPYTSTSSNIMIMNGAESRSESTIYTYVYSADKPGTANVPEAKIAVGNTEYKSQKGSIEIIGSNSADKPVTKAAPKPKSDAFVKVIPSTTSAYVNQGVTLDVWLYYNSQANWVAPKKLFTFGNAFSEFIPVDINDSQLVEHNGQRYTRRPIARYIIYPREKGKIEIPSVTYEIGVDDEYELTTTIKYKTDPVTINVMDIPDAHDLPGIYLGVGRIIPTSRVTHTRMRPGESNTYTITLSNASSIMTIQPPTILFPHGFEVGTPVVNINNKISGNTYSRTITIEYPFTATEYGEFEIEPVEFNQLNPATGRFETLSAPGQTVRVDNGRELPQPQRRSPRGNNSQEI